MHLNVIWSPLWSPLIFQIVLNTLYLLGLLESQQTLVIQVNFPVFSGATVLIIWTPAGSTSKVDFTF